MDRATRGQSNIHGSWSGNSGDGNVFGSNNTIKITNVLPDMTNFAVGNRGDVFGARAGACKPHRFIPYARNSTFTSRKNLLELIKKYSESNTHNRIALHGLGGSGKTQIALEYVYQCANESDCHVFWVQGSGLLKFGGGFRDVAQHVQIPLASAKPDEGEFLLGVRRWFEGPNSGDWILVIDNADNDTDFSGNNSPIAKFIPQGTKGTIILTTRSRLVASRQGCKMIEVGRMGEEDALELFSKRFSGSGSWGGEEKRAIEMTLAAVHHLPLAIVGAVAFMVETETPPSAYWAILQESDERAKRLLSQQFCDIQREVDVTESVLGTYFVTFDRITRQMPPAAHLLRLVAFFDRQNIPEELLRQCGFEGMDDPVEFRQAIGKLLGFSLVTTIKREEKIFYELHRLVQLSLQVYLPAGELIQGRTAALSVVSRLFPRCWEERRCVGPVYIPHALAVTKDLRDPVAEELDFLMGQYFLDIGFYNNAETQFRRCIALREEGKEHDWDDKGQRRFRFLGMAYIRLGKANMAEKIFRDSLEGIDKSLGSTNPDVLDSITSLAEALRSQGKHDESEAMNRRALEGYERTLGPDHPNTLTSANNLAPVLRYQGKYRESEAMSRRALEGYEKILGPDHPDTLTSFSNLALVLRYQGKYDESVAMDRRALEGREKILGPDHPDTLTSVNNLALVLQYQGKYGESEAMSQRALEGYDKILGPDHPSTLTSVNNLAQVLLAQGKYDESVAMNRRALEGREKILGPDYPDTLASVNNLALVLRYQGKYGESEAMSRRALEGRTKILGPDHPETLKSAKNLAALLQLSRRCNESVTTNPHGGEIQPRKLDPRRPQFLGDIVSRFGRIVGFGKQDGLAG